MLRQCPYFQKCSSVERRFFGNNEYHCMGITSYDNCMKYKELEMIAGPKIQSPYTELNRVLREISKYIQEQHQHSILMLVCDSNGNILHCDSGIKENLEYLVNVIKSQFFKMDLFTHHVIDDGTLNCYDLFRVSDEGMLVLISKEGLKSESEHVESILGPKLHELNEKIKNYVSWLSMVEKTRSTTIHTFLDRVQEFESQLQGVNSVGEILKEINQIYEIVTRIFAWHPILHELGTIKQKYEMQDRDRLLTPEDKKLILNKVNQWKKLIV
ncbi:MAG: hypothetical protein ACXQS8_05895 [Candidatus Helarchaeales archaeon]